MKFIFKKILQYYLKYITKLVLFIHQPVIIAVSGSTNKTFVKDEIKKVLLEKGLGVRANPKNFNTEIGLPLAVLNLPSGYNSFQNWIPVIWESFFSIFRRNFPQFLVLELGVSRKGDMKYLLSIVKPKISIITDITQRYLEAFSDMDDLFEEYETLIRKTPRNGLVILNYDNIRLQKIFSKIKSKKQSFGIEEGSDWQIIDTQKIETGQIFKVQYEKETKDYKINRFGAHHIFAKVAGLVVEKNLNSIKK